MSTALTIPTGTEYNDYHKVFLTHVKTSRFKDVELIAPPEKTTTSMTRVLIADDHAVFRDGLRRILEASVDLEVAGETDDGHKALELARDATPDVLILDISMPGRPALDVVEELARRLPQVRVLILTAHPEDQHAVRFLQAGASGYVTKTAPAETLLDAIRKVAQGGKHISPDLAERIAFSVGPGSALRPHERLSPREYQVMRLIASGRTPTQIASELCLSVKTVSTYRSRILEKMDLENNAAIMLYAVREGLVS